MASDGHRQKPPKAIVVPTMLLWRYGKQLLGPGHQGPRCLLGQCYQQALQINQTKTRGIRRSGRGPVPFLETEAASVICVDVTGEQSPFICKTVIDGQEGF